MSKCLYCQTELPEGYGMVCSSCQKDLSLYSGDCRKCLHSNLKILGVDISNVPMQEVQVIVGVEPKVKCKSKVLQSLLLKLFGYRVIQKNVQGKVVTLSSNDFSRGNIPTTIHI